MIKKTRRHSVRLTGRGEKCETSLVCDPCWTYNKKTRLALLSFNYLSTLLLVVETGIVNCIEGQRKSLLQLANFGKL